LVDRQHAEKVADRVCNRAGDYLCAVVRKDHATKPPTYHVQNAEKKSFKPSPEVLVGVFNAACHYGEIVDLILWDAARATDEPTRQTQDD